MSSASVAAAALLLMATASVPSCLGLSSSLSSSSSSCSWPALDPGYDVRGDSVHRPAATTPTACCAACDEFPQCKAWILRQVNGTDVVCNLKTELGEVYDCGVAICLQGRISTSPAPPGPAPPCPGGGAPSSVSHPRPFQHLQRQPSEPVAEARRAALAQGKVQPHVFIFLQDDLGHDDVAFYGNTVNLDVTGNITAAANEGVILERHYVHWHCSPTRRSVLTGRLPLHHSEYLSNIAGGDDIDLRWKTIGHKMREAGYATHWYGKGHTGYKSWRHLPQQLGFDDFVGFLGGAQDHFSAERWGGNCPYSNTSYSADIYGDHALRTLQAYDPQSPQSKPLFFYLPWQNVHAPYQAPNGWQGDVLRGMLAATDEWMGRLVNTLKSKGMWNNSVLLYSADNGGDDLGCNWPLRGSKHTNWEGGMRAASFISGGLVPESVRGTRSRVVSHIADWYTTACELANPAGGPEFVMCRDDPAVAPAPVDFPGDPCIENPMVTPCKDIYGNNSFPGVDGKNVWDAHTHPEQQKNVSAVHEQLWLSAEVLIRGDLKLLVAQQEPAKTQQNPIYGWKCGGISQPRCNTTNSSIEPYVDATPEQCACGCAFKNRTNLVPCLFNVTADISEYTDISSKYPQLRQQMWADLNRSNLELFARAPGPRVEGSSPAELIGKCNASCSNQFWDLYEAKAQGPMCGVPACTNETQRYRVAPTFE